MKKLLLTSFAVAAFLLQTKAQTFSHAVVPVTGFTADVIADGAGSAANSTNADVDGVNYNFVAQNFVNPTNQSPTSYLPTSGLINSLVTSGLPFQLAPYTGNNSLRLTTGTGTNIGTLTLVTPRSADKINILATTAYSGTFTATVNFSDATTQDFTNNVVPNWFDGASPAIQGISRVLRTTNVIENSTTNPRLYQFVLTLSAANAAKTIQSITFTKTTTVATEVLHIFAVSASTAIPNDGGVSTITSPVSPVAPGSQAVTVTVKNYGASLLNSATIGWSVNKVAQPNFAFTASPGLATNAVSTPVTIGNFNFPQGVNTVKAWTKLPNGVADGLATNDTVQLSVTACNTLSGIYTINKNAAATTTNFPSFAAALQVLTSCGVSGPVTFNVVAGSGPYNEQITLPAITGSSATNTITFEGNGNTLTAPTTLAKQGVIYFNGADYVKVNNFTINVELANQAGFGVQLVNASDNDIVSNCTINVPLTSVSGSYNGIFIGANTSTAGNYANNALIQNNTINGGFYGITLVGTTTGTTTTGNRIIGNQIRDAYAYGIYMNIAGTGTIVEGNDISRATRINGGNFFGIYFTGATTNTTVSKNRIHNTHDMSAVTANTIYGIYTLAPATVGNENIIKNNLIYNINNQGGTFYALYNSGGNGTYYYHNTVSADDPLLSYSLLRGIHFSTAVTNVKFINNILSLSGTASTKHAIYLTQTTIALVSDNNDLYIGSMGNIGYFGVDKTSLADWKATNTNAYDQNSISAYPTFLNPSNNFRPLVAALNDGGQALPAVTDDFLGLPRNTLTPDMGAYEFTPAANDAGVTAIVAPTVAVTPGTQPVSVHLKNFGTAPLTTATIRWSVNGTLQTNSPWTGNLASLASTTTPVTIGSYNFTAGAYTLKVWTQSPNGAIDPLAANDTTILRLNSCVPLAGNYTINKNNPTAGTNFHSISEAVLKLGNCGVSAPVTLTVTTGTGPYNEQVEILNIPNASATNTVTFEGSGNIVSVIPGFRPGIFVLNGAKFVKLNNFVIELPATATIGWGIQLINAADNNTISNNTINLPLALTGEVHGIVAGTAITTLGNNTSNTKILNNNINGGVFSINLNGNVGGVDGSNNQIIGNQLKDMFANAIYISSGNGTLIEGNDISRPLRTNGSSIYGVYLNGVNLNTIVNKNRIHNTYDAMPTNTSTTYGVYTASSATVGNENIIKNNLIYNIKNATGSFYPFYNAAASGTYYYHNTVLSDATATYNFLRGIYYSAAVTNVKFINNILWLPGTSNAKYAIYVNTPTGTSIISNNNVLFVDSKPNCYVGYYSSNQATLANWKAVNTNAYDQNSVETDPVFAAPATGNLTPTALTLDNLGQPVPAVIDDILGANRNSTTPDMGAYEFGTPANDAGITAITAPNSGCGLTNAETVTITLKNFGPAALTSIPVSYTVNGGAAVNETFTGSIATGATTNYSFTAKANLAAPASYVIVATANLANDGVSSNNSFTKTVVSSAAAAVPTVTAGGSTALCTGGSVVLTCASTTTGATYAWYRNGTAITGATSATYTANTAGSYTVIATANSCPSAYSAVTNVTVNAIPATPTISQSGFVLTSNSATGNQWYLNGSAITGATAATYTTSANGAYTVIVTTNGCSSTVSAAVTIVNTGIAKDLNLALAVYPNPSEGLVNLTLPKGQAYEIQVTDLTGKVILTEKVTSGKTQLNLSKAAKGIYLLKVTGENGSAVRKLIIE